MKTGIVMEIKDRIAVVMKTGGEFVEVKAESRWKKGDTVTLKSNVRSFKTLYTVAACFAILFLAVFGGYRLYYTEASLISMDINPSLELSVNRFGKVIAVNSYNDDAAELIGIEDVKGLSYQKAIETLLQSDDMRSYLENNEYLDFAVFSREDDAEVTEYLNTYMQTFSAAYPENSIKCSRADEATVSAAHSHGMSIGKYLAFLELQELDPELEAEEYSGCGISEIRNQIRNHHQGGNGQGNHGNGDTQGNDNGPNGSGNGRQHHGGE